MRRLGDGAERLRLVAGKPKLHQARMSLLKDQRRIEGTECCLDALPDCLAGLKRHHLVGNDAQEAWQSAFRPPRRRQPGARHDIGKALIARTQPGHALGNIVFACDDPDAHAHDIAAP